jgi:uncharacterized protein (DUF1501 family)
VSFGPELPHVLRGSKQAVSIESLSDFKMHDARSASAFEVMYGGSRDQVLNGTARDAFDAVRRVQAVASGTYIPAGNARYPTSKLGQNLMQIARLAKADLGLEVAFTDVAGWDHHINEVGARSTIGTLADLLRDFGQSLAAFYNDLGDRMSDVSVVTMSEFGRTAAENGNRGTDHGHANVMMVLGGGVKGGKIYGDWPGLEPHQLYENRDLNMTTDFRDVLGELVIQQLGNQRLSTVFPGYDQPKFRGLLGS